VIRDQLLGGVSGLRRLGTGGVVAPMLAAWAPNLLFGAGAAYLLLHRPDVTALTGA
jgi:lipopolysaccharide export LptBFGC system permease protein LptF